MKINLEEFYIHEIKLSPSYRAGTLLFNIRPINGNISRRDNDEKYVKEIKKSIKKNNNIKLILSDSIVEVRNFGGFARLILDTFPIISFKINNNTTYNIQYDKSYVRENKLDEILNKNNKI